MTLTEPTLAPLAAFVRGRVRDGRITGKYAGRSVEAWVEPAAPPREGRHRFHIEVQAGVRGASWRYRGGSTWTRPHDRHAPLLAGDDPAVIERLRAGGVPALLASLDPYRPEIEFDGATGIIRYQQVVPGAAHFPPSDTFAQILSTLHRVADANRAAQRGR